MFFFMVVFSFYGDLHLVRVVADDLSGGRRRLLLRTEELTAGEPNSLIRFKIVPSVRYLTCEDNAPAVIYQSSNGDLSVILISDSFQSRLGQARLGFPERMDRPAARDYKLLLEVVLLRCKLRHNH
jgi:hypothetical protein